MKKMKRSAAVLAALLLLAALLGGCGSSGYGGNSSSATASAPSFNGVAQDAAAPADAPAPEPAGGWTEAETAFEDTAGGTLPQNVKLIYTADISMESTEFDRAAAELSALVAECGGWFEHSRVNNYNRSYRNAFYTVRVPAERFFSFCENVGALCQVNSINRDTQDVSEDYYDTESRLITQKTKLARLQALLAQAENMEDIIALESAISETELAIEQLTGTLRRYDSLVGYSTVTISLSEVSQLSGTEAPAIGFGAKLAAAFRSGSRSFVSGIQDFLLGFARGWAGWLLFLLVVAGIVLLSVRGHRRRREREQGAYPRKERKQSRRGRRGAEPDETAAPPLPRETPGDSEDP